MVIMKLETYLEQNNLKQKQFGDMIGKDKVYVHRVVKKNAIPSPADMAIIVAVTNGDVQPNDFYDMSDRASL